MSEPVRFLSLELNYGCHTGSYDLEADGPLVLLGPNGAGKTTIIEAIVRTLYGFRRGRKDDRRSWERRRPWFAGEYAARLTLVGPEGRFTIERDFDTDEVTVLSETEPRPVFQGEANPAGSNESAREYRRLLARVVGLTDLDAYERTAFVGQGTLAATTLTDDILQIAAGGHADVESARDALSSEYARLTVEPIEPGASRRRKPGELERLDEAIEALARELETARTAEARRAPLARDRDRVAAEIQGARAEVELLEAAFAGLSELERLNAMQAAASERLAVIERAEIGLDECVARLELLDEQIVIGGAQSFPADYPERLGALQEGLWPRERELAELRDATGKQADRAAVPPAVPTVAIYLAAILLAAAGIALAIAGATLSGLAIAAGGPGLALFALLGARHRAEAIRLAHEQLERVDDDLADVRRRIRRSLDGIPDGETLTPASLTDRRKAYERALAERRMLDEGRSAVRGMLDRVREILDRHESVTDTRDTADAAAPVVVDDAASGPTPDDRLAARGRETLRRLRDAANREREETTAPLKLQIREASRSRLALPDGIAAESSAVMRALRERRKALARSSDKLASIERRIAYEGRSEESPLAIEQRRTALLDERRAVAARAAAYRHAHLLIADAYEEFRQTDQERLLEGVSSHLALATRGALGPVAAAGGLDAARVHVEGRPVPLESPPLSYGQLHSALFAVRLGAADFLAELGARVPLLVDDPFVHLDEVRAGELWRVLERISAERQVILATQDRLLLDHLGVGDRLVVGTRRDSLPGVASGPDAAESARPSSSPARTESPGQSGPEPRSRSEEPLDLFGPPSGEA